MHIIQRLLAECLGTAFLLAIVVGSGIMAERLAAGNSALALLANAIATGAGLSVLILMFAEISGAHFNPAVSLVKVFQREHSASEALAYIAAQLVGAMAGVAAAHAMFDLAAYTASHHSRAGPSQIWSEFVATFGLILVVLRVPRYGVPTTALSVGAYIAAAYWFTASTSFANPAVSLARAFTDTFSGIRLVDVPGFVVAQLGGAMAAVWAHRLLGSSQLVRSATN